jgi:hypothetical protein
MNRAALPVLAAPNPHLVGYGDPRAMVFSVRSESVLGYRDPRAMSGRARRAPARS